MYCSHLLLKLVLGLFLTLQVAFAEGYLDGRSRSTTLFADSCDNRELSLFEAFHDSINVDSMKSTGLAAKDFDGFKLRGIKGWNWTPEQTLEEIPFLEKFRMNFFMNCYTSTFDFPKSNEWWKPFSDEFKAKYELIVNECQSRNIEFCFAMNPSLVSARPIDYRSDTDFELLWSHYEWMVNLKVNWFSLCLDDISTGMDAEGQAFLVNRLLSRLRLRNPNAQLIFCPTIYASTYSVEGIDDNVLYLKTLAKELDKDVYCFWTGDFVCGPISSANAKTFRELLGHRIIIWDNYPVNDGHNAMHLGPVVHRDIDLPLYCDGYISNPMETQSRINRVPMYTCADYAFNTKLYEPSVSIANAILAFCETPEQMVVIKDLVELYYGFLLHGAYAPNNNTVRADFTELLKLRQGYRFGGLFIKHLQHLVSRLESEFPGELSAEIQTINNDIKWMRAAIADR